MAEIIEINEKTWRIEEGMVRFFVLEGAEKAVMIDSGMNTPDAEEYAGRLTDKPIILMNTHADPDHISGNKAFKGIYMNPAEEENYREHGGVGDIIPICDGDVIDPGNRPLEIIELPGHTPGSVAILDVNSRVLYSGDSVQDGNIFMFGKFRDINRYIESMKKLRTYEERFDLIFPCHGNMPVQKELIQKLIEGATEIADGTAQGTEAEMFGKRFMHYKFSYAGFFGELS